MIVFRKLFENERFYLLLFLIINKKRSVLQSTRETYKLIIHCSLSVIWIVFLSGNLIGTQAGCNQFLDNLTLLMENKIHCKDISKTESLNR